MNIGRQWNDRLRLWAEQFPKHYYKAHAPLSLSYFTTMEQLPYGEAVKRAFVPAPTGMKWGRKWEYGWFRTRIVIPQALEGKRLVFTLAPAEEMLVWINGTEAGSIDRRHRMITLTRFARTGEVYEIIAECYAGHGVRNRAQGRWPGGRNPSRSLRNSSLPSGLPASVSGMNPFSRLPWTISPCTAWHRSCRRRACGQ